ncbi:DgyrCDS2601 [Dimorphilus gyrociliatus]|uniref:Anoctamin n=1 Tax=Dimorphilus gyrociliatus TaxID=2664684 RepID=A0A7I8VCK5_9ANNE|nr:DgyrCDS2601 [Dimorphilus gyrociliatus]
MTELEDVSYERDSSMFFRSEHKRIDYIIVYQDYPKSEEDYNIRTKQRKEFEKNLISKGLELEYDPEPDSEDYNRRKYKYIKIHASWKCLLEGAEKLALQKRLKHSSNRIDEALNTNCLSCSCRNFTGFPPLPEDIECEPNYFTAPFDNDDIEQFDIELENQDEFFTNAERSLIVDSVLAETAFPDYDDDDEESTGNRMTFGIDKLVKLDIYRSCYPLHESLKRAESDDEDRRNLRLYWANWKRIFTFQPLDLVRKYFGEKISIYFCWLGFYTGMLIPVAIIGFVCFIYGVASFFRQEPVKDICEEDRLGNLILCPKCDRGCTFTRLKNSCLNSRLSYIFDNNSTLAFALIMSIWATVFLEFWKRAEKRVQYDWDVSHYEEEEKMRPEYELNNQKRENPITKKMEAFIPWTIKGPRKCLSLSVVLFMITLVLATIFGVIVYRIIFVAVLYSLPHNLIKERASIITTITAALINLIAIQLLSFIYRKLAKYLTDIEAPKTNTQYDNSFTLKMFLFQFINYYGSIFYIAFFKGRFAGKPGDKEGYFLGKWRQDECDPAGCFVDLFIQLAIIMGGKQIFNNVKELAIPLVRKYLRLKIGKTEHKPAENARWEIDRPLLDPPDNMFDEYLEMGN